MTIVGSGDTSAGYQNRGVIYSITNLATGKAYIGRTYAPLEYRISQHVKLLRSKKHSNKAFQNDFDVYGEQAFFVQALESVESHDPKMRERYWMNALQTYDEQFGYNSLDPAAKKLRREHGLSVKSLPQKGIPKALYVPKEERNERIQNS